MSMDNTLTELALMVHGMNQAEKAKFDTILASLSREETCKDMHTAISVPTLSRMEILRDQLQLYIRTRENLMDATVEYIQIEIDQEIEHDGSRIPSLYYYINILIPYMNTDLAYNIAHISVPSTEVDLSSVSQIATYIEKHAAYYPVIPFIHQYLSGSKSELELQLFVKKAYDVDEEFVNVALDYVKKHSHKTTLAKSTIIREALLTYGK